MVFNQISYYLRTNLTLFFVIVGTAGTTPLVVPTPSHVLPLIGGVIAAVVLIALVLVAVIVCFCISNAKRKSVVRRMQMDVLARCVCVCVCVCGCTLGDCDFDSPHQ